MTNFYTNYGDTKHIFDYMFTNLYSEKTTKLVKLNLATDEEQSEENVRKTKARVIKLISMYSLWKMNLSGFGFVKKCLKQSKGRKFFDMDI